MSDAELRQELLAYIRLWYEAQDQPIHEFSKGYRVEKMADLLPWDALKKDGAWWDHIVATAVKALLKPST